MRKRLNSVLVIFKMTSFSAFPAGGPFPADFF